MQRVHNGHVRQGWILLINPTGYIVPSARTDIPSLRFSTPPPAAPAASFPKQRRVALLQCAPVSPPLVPLDLLFSASPRARERYPFVGMSCVADERAAPAHWCASLLYHSHYARLRQRRYCACSTAAQHPRAVPFSSVWKRTRRCRAAAAKQSATERDSPAAIRPPHPPLPGGTTVRRLPRSRSLAGGGRCSIRRNSPTR